MQPLICQPLGRDPSSAQKLPRNPRGMWQCVHCGAWNDPENECCYYCDTAENDDEQ
jgi:hypothetical protein